MPYKAVNFVPTCTDIFTYQGGFKYEKTVKLILMIDRINTRITDITYFIPIIKAFLLFTTIKLLSSANLLLSLSVQPSENLPSLSGYEPKSYYRKM